MSEGRVDPIFRCFDCRQREVVLETRIWHEHIITAHTGLEGLEDQIQLTVEQPFTIRRDTRRDDRETYYRSIDIPGIYTDFLKVVVEFTKHPPGLWVGTIVTAYEAELIKSKEKQIWP